jgi:hypothetical protein
LENNNNDENGNNFSINEIDQARHIIKIDSSDDENDDEEFFDTNYVERSFLSLSAKYGEYSKSLSDIHTQDIPQNSFMMSYVSK